MDVKKLEIYHLKVLALHLMREALAEEAEELLHARNFRTRRNQMCLRCWQQTTGKQGHPHHLILVKQSHLMLGNYVLCSKESPSGPDRWRKLSFLSLEATVLGNRAGP